jgi:hypothetical protein
MLGLGNIETLLTIQAKLIYNERKRSLIYGITGYGKLSSLRLRF